MVNKVESINMFSLLIYSVHSTQEDVCLCFAAFSAYDRPKMIYITVMLSLRLPFKRCFFKKFF